MLRIRLQRVGRKKAPSYRVIVSERTKDPYAGGIEILGHYNPLSNPKTLELKKDRIEHWLSVGAQPSNTVANLLVREGIISGDKKKAVKISKKRQVKIDEKNAAAIEEKKRLEEEAKAAKEAEAAAKKEAEEAAKAAEAEVAVETPAETLEEKTEEAPAEEPSAEETPEEEKKEE